MIRPASDARRYRIIVRSECGSLLASLVDNAQVEMSPGTGDTGQAHISSVRESQRAQVALRQW